MQLFHELRERIRRWVSTGGVKNTRLRRLALGGLFFALLTLILSTQTSSQRIVLKPGEVAPQDYKAPQDFVNRVATQDRVKQAVDRVPTATKRNPEVLAKAESAINYAFDRIPKIRTLTNQDAKTKIGQLRDELKLTDNLRDEVYEAALSLDDRSLQSARDDALRLVRTALQSTVSKADVEARKAAIDNEPPTNFSSSDAQVRSFIKALAKANIAENAVEDPDQTEKAREAEAKSVDKVMWKKDQLILRKSEPVTIEQYEAMVDLGLTGPRAGISSLFGTALLSAVAIALVALYLIRYRPDIWERSSKLLLLGAIGVITLLLSLLMGTFRESVGTGVTYLMPVAFNSMLVGILLDPKVALIQSTVLTLLVGIGSVRMATSLEVLNPLVVAIVGAAVGIYGLRRVDSRTDIYRAGFYVSLANVVTIAGLFLLQAQFPDSWMGVGLPLGLGFANGLIVAVLVTGALPFFENLFGIVTPLRLLELSNPNHPLLKKLLVEAPGSYHHTILVANLCEAAAEAIGADPILSRVGAYYHDIGKTKRPYFFVENQMGGENPHDKLPPSLSAMIITSHVKDGLEMAREAGLPQEIIDFISEHHGTMLVSYFYHMASKGGQSEFVLEEDFRYEGPRPHSKETAICMLADGCEASVRAMRQKGPLTLEQIEAQVKRVFDDRLHQGQLEECDLTLRDLDVTARTFVKVLGGVHHARIEYPPGALEAKPEEGQTGAAAPKPAEGDPSASVQEEKQVGDVDQQRAAEPPTDGSAGGPDRKGGAGDAEASGSTPG